MKLVILDGYTENPGDLSWDWLKDVVDEFEFDDEENDKEQDGHQNAADGLDGHNQACLGLVDAEEAHHVFGAGAEAVKVDSVDQKSGKAQQQQEDQTGAELLFHKIPLIYKIGYILFFCIRKPPARLGVPKSFSYAQSRRSGKPPLCKGRCHGVKP